jgi:hypothetical protein
MHPEGKKYRDEQDQVEALRLILELEQDRHVSEEEAQGIGRDLIDFFEILAEEPIINEQMSLGIA